MFYKSLIMVKKASSKMLKNAYYISSIFIAIIAILGFIVSISNSRKTAKTIKETSETLQKLSSSLSSFIEPYLDFGEITWLPGKGPLSCQNPPIGFHVEFINTSNVPIIIKNESLKLFFGGTEIANERNSINKGDEGRIVPPGKSTGMTVADVEIRNALNNKTNMLEPPFLRLDFNATISTFDKIKVYVIHLINDYGIDCNNYNTVNVMKVKSNIEISGEGVETIDDKGTRKLK